MNLLSKTFSVNPVNPLSTEIVPAIRDDTNATVVTDAASARSNLKDLLDVGSQALKEAIAIAVEAEDPRGFDAVTNMISALADLNAKIMTVHSIEQKLTAESKITTAVQNNTTTNNIVFTGTTKDLSKLLNADNEKGS